VDKIDFASAEIVAKLPDYFDPQRGPEIPTGLIGATIIGFGTLAEAGTVHGGGLVIDYRPAVSETVQRLVLAHTDVAAWVAFQGTRSPASSQALPQG
jgi:hypothetical protein